jgi:hypothetical protein
VRAGYGLRATGFGQGVVLAIAVATLLAGQPAWGHSFPAVRTVVLQVERCEAVLLVGYRPGSGEATQSVLARASTDPSPRPIDALRDVLAVDAMAPLGVSVDGKALVRTSIRAKVGIEPGGMRPMVVLLVTYALPAGGGTLSLTSRDTHSTEISWQDRDSSRLSGDVPEEHRWYEGVASFLLSLRPVGGMACGTSRSSR